MVRATRRSRSRPRADRPSRSTACRRRRWPSAPGWAVRRRADGARWALAASGPGPVARAAWRPGRRPRGLGRRRILAGRPAGLVERQGRDGHVEVDPVQEGAGQAAEVGPHLPGRARAGRDGRAPAPAGAGVHGRDQLEAGRHPERATVAGDRDLPSSSGCGRTSRVARPELGSSSRKRTPLWARLTSPGRGRWPPPTRGHVRGRVVGTAERASPDRLLRRQPGGRVNRGGLDGLVRREGRQDAGRRRASMVFPEPAAPRGAGCGRGGRDLQGPAGQALPRTSPRSASGRGQ